MSEHLLHFELDQFGVTVKLTCTHAPDDPAWFPRDCDGDGEICGDECWTINWVDAEGAESYLVGHWPEDPPSPCPVECEWSDGLDIKCARSVFRTGGAA